MLEQDALAQMLQQLRAEQTAAEADLVVLQRRVNSLRQAVAGIEGLLDTKPTTEGSLTAADTAYSSARALTQATGQAVDTGTTQPVTETPQFQDAKANPLQVFPPDRPRGAEAVRRVFAESEGTPWTVQEMTIELERRGWTPDSKNPVDAVRTAMTRVWRAPNSGVSRDGSKFLYRPSRNGDGPSAREGVSGDQEMSEAALAFTEGSQQPDTSPEQS
jgi:hypothetical protein